MDREALIRIAFLEGRVRQMETAMQALLGRLGIDPAEIIPQRPQQDQVIWDTLRSGDKITAIDLYRHQYGIGLKEAKEAVDAMERQVRGY